MSDEKPVSKVKLGGGDSYPVTVTVKSGVCDIVIERDFLNESGYGDHPKNFPIRLSLTEKDALLLVAEITTRLAIFAK